MALDDLSTVDSTALESWHWYVVVGYPAVSVLGIFALGRLTEGGSILASSLGTLGLLVLMTAFGVVSLPALWADAAYVRDAHDGWEPDETIYVGAAIATPAFLGIVGGLAAGFGVGVALAVFSFVVATISVSVAYLFNRHRSVGLLVR